MNSERIMLKRTFLTVLLTIFFSTYTFSAEMTPEELAKEGTIAYYHENYLEANKLLSQAGAQGNAEAHYYLGAMHFNGQGVVQSYERSVENFSAAAAKHHSGAQMILGVLYIQGVGVPQNFKRAARLLLLAAKQNNVNAQEILGWIHQNGVGVRQSSMIAYAIWNYVAANGSDWARINRNYVLAHLSDREVYEAQELSLHIQKLWALVERQNASHPDNRRISHRRRS